MSAQLSAVLRSTRDRLAVPGQWTRGTFARDAAGKSVSSLDKTAARWCIEGALLVEVHKVCPALDAERELFYAAIQALPFETRTVNDSLVSVEPLLALFDRAILEAEGR